MLDKSIGQNLRGVMSLHKSIVLDQSQMNALLSGLTQKVSIIQGPPGMSFVQYLTTIDRPTRNWEIIIRRSPGKIIHDYSDLKILVVCYTNHALDQFLEDLLDVGIPIEQDGSHGWKVHNHGQRLWLLQYQQSPTRFTSLDYSVIDRCKRDIEQLSKILARSFSENLQQEISIKELMVYLDADSKPSTRLYKFLLQRTE